MKRSIWVKKSEKVLVDLGFQSTSVSVARKINGAFTMADGYAVPEEDFDEVLVLLSECKVHHEVE